MRRGFSNGAKWMVALAVSASLTTGCGKNDVISQAEKKDAAKGIAAPGIAETKAIAEDGFIYGLPLVMNYAVMNEFAVDTNSSQFKAPFNEINNEHRVFDLRGHGGHHAEQRHALLDALARSARGADGDLGAGGGKKRYYSVQLIDGNTYNYGYIGSRATGSEPGNYLIVGPDWKGETPAGIKKVFSSTTPFALTLFRTQLFNPADMPNVEKVQAGYKAQPLSAFLKQPAPPAAPKIDFVPATTEGIKANFFEYLDAALQFVPASADDKEIRARLATIGIGPGKTFEFKDLSAEHKAAILLAMKEGDDKVDKYPRRRDEEHQRLERRLALWRSRLLQGRLAEAGRAAKGGLYGNDAVEAMYPYTRTDASGETLDGSKHNYTLTFPAGQLPPVNAFWSVTMYDGKSQLLIKNPINRYLINSPMLPSMKKNADGSLTLYIQKDSPGKAKEANWLPAPNDTIYLVMRLYWPKTDPPSILPAGEGTWQPPAVKVAA